jgi:hypothetical protein
VLFGKIIECDLKLKTQLTPDIASPVVLENKEISPFLVGFKLGKWGLWACENLNEREPGGDGGEKLRFPGKKKIGEMKSRENFLRPKIGRSSPYPGGLGSDNGGIDQTRTFKIGNDDRERGMNLRLQWEDSECKDHPPKNTFPPE